MKYKSFESVRTDERPPAGMLPAGGRRRTQAVLKVFFAVLLAACAGLNLAARDPWKAPEQAAALSNPLSANKEAVEKGKAIYLDRCIDCHGKKGKGDGSGAADLETRPPDFTQAQVRQQTDGQIFWKISEGRKPMPGYGRKLSEEQRWQLVAYMRTLPAR